LYSSSHSAENRATAVWAYACGSRVRLIKHLLRVVWVSICKWNNTGPAVIDVDYNPLLVALKIETYDVAYSHQNGGSFKDSLSAYLSTLISEEVVVFDV